MSRGDTDDLDALLAEQIAYYRARAPEYTKTSQPDLTQRELSAAWRELSAAIEQFAPAGDVLELACGPGTWTSELMRHADRLTAVDAAPEMLKLAADNVRDERVRFIEADLFEWTPNRRYDAVFFGFWLSHVPLERFAPFWSTVRGALKPSGRVMFLDDAYRTPEELIEGEDSSTVERRLRDGRRYRAVKVPHTPDGLRRLIAALGWNVRVEATAGRLFWGVAIPPRSPGGSAIRC